MLHLEAQIEALQTECQQLRNAKKEVMERDHDDSKILEMQK